MLVPLRRGVLHTKPAEEWVEEDDQLWSGDNTSPFPHGLLTLNMLRSSCMVLSFDSAQGWIWAEPGDWELPSAHGNRTCGEGESCFRTTSSNSAPWLSSMRGVAGISTGTAAATEVGRTRGEQSMFSPACAKSGELKPGLYGWLVALWLPKSDDQSRSPGKSAGPFLLSLSYLFPLTILSCPVLPLWLWALLRP